MKKKKLDNPYSFKDTFEYSVGLMHISAYRSGHSTETVLLRILSDILIALDDDKISISLLLDLSAAFDTTNHEILLSHLEHDFDIGSTPLNWCRSYLSDRK